MRKSLFLFLFSTSVASYAIELDLGRLMESAKRHPAPIEMRKYLADEMQKELSQCVSEQRWGLKKAEDFFAAVPIRLAKGDSSTWLAFPTQYCPGGMFGASSTPYWILRRAENGEYKQLLTGTTHRVKILKKVTNGFHDLADLYGNNEEGNGITMYSFNGRQYEP
jgi:hypothetical protein